MLEFMPYVIYVLGPLALAIVIARRWRGASWVAFGLGFPAFFLAWLGTTTTMIVATVIGVGEETLGYAFAISIGAGVFEESARWVTFRFMPPLRHRRDGPNMLMYGAGHSGMESLIVAGTLVLTVVVITHYPELLDEPVREQSRAVVDRPVLMQHYDAIERVIVGFIIHTAFTGVVLLGLRRRAARYLVLAMAWHFAHDMVAFNVHRVSTHWTMRAAWIGFIVVAYSWAIVALYRRLAAPPADASAAEAPVQ